MNMKGPNGAFAGYKAWQQVGPTEMDSWYDITEYRVPFRGSYNHSAIHGILNEHVGRAGASLGKFGGWTSYDIGPDNGDGTFTVRSFRHIGD
jgi:hypothetical protein